MNRCRLFAALCLLWALLSLAPRVFSAPHDEKTKLIARGKYLAVDIGGKANLVSDPSLLRDAPPPVLNNQSR